MRGIKPRSDGPGHLVSQNRGVRSLVRSFPRFDALLAGCLFLAGLVELAAGIGGPSRLVEYLTLPLATLALVARRSHPIWVGVAGVGGLLVETAAGVPQNKGFIPLLGWLVVVYTIGSELTFRRSAVAAAGITGAVLVAVALHPTSRAGDFLFVLGLATTAWGVGRVMRSRAEQNRRLAEAQGELARAAVAAERTRIARELHDVVAHAMSVMVVHAQAARELVQSRPDAASDALQTIETTGRVGLVEMHRLVGLLRKGEDAKPTAHWGLNHIDVLIEQVRAAGVAVTTEIGGDVRDLPAGLDLCAYRIIQEALTNVIKHANSKSATVRVFFGLHELELEVTDDGRALPPGQPTGHGLIGMRERVDLYGGTLQAGHRAGGGFVVHAVLPTPTP